VYGWGLGEQGQLASHTQGALLPTKIGLPKKLEKVVCGWWHTYVITSAGIQLFKSFHLGASFCSRAELLDIVETSQGMNSFALSRVDEEIQRLKSLFNPEELKV